jgi:hypothetical protein
VSKPTLEEIIQRIEESVPYVQATLSPGSSVSTSNPEWIAVHKGRANSSVCQLEALLRIAREAK